MWSLTLLSAALILSKATLNGTLVTLAPSICQEKPIDYRLKKAKWRMGGREEGSRGGGKQGSRGTKEEGSRGGGQQGSRGRGKQRRRWAGEKGSRGGGEEGSRGKGEKESRGGGEQGSKGGGEQRRRGAGRLNSIKEEGWLHRSYVDKSSEIITFNILSPGPITFSNTLPLLIAVMKIPGSPGTQGRSRPPLIFNPSLPSCPENERVKILSVSIFNTSLILCCHLNGWWRDIWPALWTEHHGIKSRGRWSVFLMGNEEPFTHGPSWKT